MRDYTDFNEVARLPRYITESYTVHITHNDTMLRTAWCEVAFYAEDSTSRKTPEAAMTSWAQGIGGDLSLNVKNNYGFLEAHLAGHRLDIRDVEALFNAARETGQRYVAVIDQNNGNDRARNEHFTAQYVLMTNDAENILRFLREKGLRPGAPDTSIRRLLDTQRTDIGFLHQYGMSPFKMWTQNFSPEAYKAHERYLKEARQLMRTMASKKGLFSRMFGKGR